MNMVLLCSSSLVGDLVSVRVMAGNFPYNYDISLLSGLMLKMKFFLAKVWVVLRCSWFRVPMCQTAVVQSDRNLMRTTDVRNEWENL